MLLISSWVAFVLALAGSWVYSARRRDLACSIQMFKEDGHKPDRMLYKGRTADNPYLPPDFLDAMRENYSPQLFKAYTEGEFCLLTQAAVYPEFNRELNKSDQCKPTERDFLYIGVDFNVARCLAGGMCRQPRRHSCDSRVGGTRYAWCDRTAKAGIPAMD